MLTLNINRAYSYFDGTTQEQGKDNREIKFINITCFIGLISQQAFRKDFSKSNPQVKTLYIGLTGLHLYYTLHIS